jgi:hypothetical protein
VTDFAYVPGGTAYEQDLVTMLNQRRNTSVVLPAASSINGFLKDLAQRANHPEDDLIIGCHANLLGAMSINVDAAHSDQAVDYEVLQDVDVSGTIDLHRLGVGKSKTRFHVKGCRIGQDDHLPYLRLLKRALGNPSQVTAPRFFHCLYYIPTGIYEWMGHSYQVHVRDAFKKREELVAELQKKKFTQLDNTPVKDDDIDKWVRKELNLNPNVEARAKIPFPVTIVPRTGGLGAINDLGIAKYNTSPALGGPQCRASVETHTEDFLQAGQVVPKNVDELKKVLENDPRFAKDHPYPIYKRHRFDTFQEFFDGMRWKRGPKTWIGSQHFYTLVIPVVKPIKEQTVGPNELIFNFYPKTGAPTMNFLEDNAHYQLFGQV